MDKDEIKGKATDIEGRVKRQTGEWTGDEELQGEGAAEQVKGKAQNTVGKVKDAARDAMEEARRKAFSARKESAWSAKSAPPDHPLLHHGRSKRAPRFLYFTFSIRRFPA